MFNAIATKSVNGITSTVFLGRYRGYPPAESFRAYFEAGYTVQLVRGPAPE